MDVIAEIKARLRDKAKKVWEKSHKRIYIDVDKVDVPAAAKILFSDLGARFIIATGIHTPAGFEILYHFDFDQYSKVVSIRATLDSKKPEIESITPIIKGAEWIEREMWELLGINFRNHPNLKRLLLDEDWPEGLYPLRQEKRE